MEVAWRKGPWTPEEDRMLIQYITNNGEGRWSSVSKLTGLKRSGKSCRLRWVNYLRPGLKKGHLTPQEEAIIIELHALWGNKWSTIARYLPGRTDNEIKNYWRTHFKSRKKPLKQEKRALPKQQQSDQTDRSMIDMISTESLEAADGEKEMGFPSIENDQILPMLNQEGASDLVPVDCYLWGGLWNLQDTAIGTALDGNDHGNDVCYAFGQGDAVDYVEGGGFIF